MGKVRLCGVMAMCVAWKDANGGMGQILEMPVLYGLGCI